MIGFGGVTGRTGGTAGARFLALVAVLAGVAGTALAAEEPAKAFWDPVRRDLEGWVVWTDPALLEGGAQAEEGARALRMLGDHLNRIAILVPEERLARLRQLELWIEWEHPVLAPMQYHPSVDWLREHGHDPRLEKKVHIPRARDLLSRGQLLKHPMVVLHELAHAYHDQVLGFDDPGIERAYEAARASGAYDQVLLYTGEKVRHYALTDAKEYFAEGTEAYFYRNDFYPFVRAELREHDSGLHAVLEEVWGPLE